MLAYVLAIVVAVGSFGLYMSAFFFPEVYRKYDLAWSGVGLFYALVLWICAGQMQGAVLLGQIASVVLLGWFVWQNLELRRSLTPVEQRTPHNQANQSLTEVVRTKSQEWTEQASSRVNQLSITKQVGGVASAIAQRGQGILSTLQPRPTAKARRRSQPDTSTVNADKPETAVTPPSDSQGVAPESDDVTSDSNSSNGAA